MSVEKIIKIKLDTSDAKADVKLIKDKISELEGNTATVSIEIDDSSVDETKSKIEGLGDSVQISIDEASVDDAISDIETKMGDITSKIGIEIDGDGGGVLDSLSDIAEIQSAASLKNLASRNKSTKELEATSKQFNKVLDASAKKIRAMEEESAKLAVTLASLITKQDSLSKETAAAKEALDNNIATLAKEHNALQDRSDALDKTIEARKAEKDIINKSSEAGKDNMSIMGALDSVTAGFATRILTNVKALGTFIKTLKITKVALISTGIGAIVVAVGALAAAFLSTEAGMDSVNKVIKPLTAALETAWGVLQKMGDGLMDIFNGDFSKGWDKMSGSVENFGDKMSDALVKGEKLYKLGLKIRGLDIGTDLAVATLEAAISKQKFVAEDTTKAYDVRKKALEDVILMEGKVMLLKKDIIKLRMQELSISQSFSDTSSADYKEYIALSIEMINTDKDMYEHAKESRNKLNSLNSEVVKSGEEVAVESAAIMENATSEFEANLKKRLDAYGKYLVLRRNNNVEAIKDEHKKQEAAIELERSTALGAATQQIEDEELLRLTLFEINRKYDKKLADYREATAAAAEVKATARAERIAATEKDELVTKLNNASQYAALTGELASIVSGFYGQQVADLEAKGITEGAEYNKAMKRQETAAIAAVNMDAASAIIGSWAAYASIPFAGAGLAIAQTVVIVASAVAQIAAIKRASKGNSSPGGGAGSVGAAPNFNVIAANEYNPIPDGSSEEQDALYESNNPPVRSYVLSKDVTTSQEFDRAVESNSSL